MVEGKIGISIPERWTSLRKTVQHFNQIIFGIYTIFENKIVPKYKYMINWFQTFEFVQNTFIII